MTMLLSQSSPLRLPPSINSAVGPLSAVTMTQPTVPINTTTTLVSLPVENQLLFSNPPPVHLNNLNVYIIDPRNFRKSEGTPPQSKISINPITRSTKKSEEKVTKKRRKPSVTDTSVDIRKVEQEMTFLKTPVTSRFGRVCKSILSNPTTDDPQRPKSNTYAAPKPSRRRDPPEVFRCQTCRKVYLGYKKLGLHYQKFPSHKPHNENEVCKKSVAKRSAEVQTDNSSNSHNGNIVSTTFSSVMRDPHHFLEPQLPLKSTSEEHEDFVDNASPKASEPEEPDFCIDCSNDVHSSSPGSPPVSFLINGNSNSQNATFFPGAETTSAPVTTSVSTSVPASDVCQPQRDLDENSNGSVLCHNVGDDESQNLSSTLKSKSPKKSVWDFVVEQIRNYGINQACGEINEMAEKLMKVARDKFIPVREDETDRLGNSVPIVHVETPFFSHLLDLPFGTYIFKEDAGVRKTVPPPPPSVADLSLTGGVEVDIDKFISPDIDTLPHLTNLDLNALCNN